MFKGRGAGYGICLQIWGFVVLVVALYLLIQHCE
jgi:hypothetical protein